MDKKPQKTPEEKNEKRIKNYKRDLHNMKTLAIATVLLIAVSVIVTIVFGMNGITYLLPTYIVTLLISIFLILSILTVRKTKKLIGTQTK